MKTLANEKLSMVSSLDSDVKCVLCYILSFLYHLPFIQSEKTAACIKSKKMEIKHRIQKREIYYK